MHAAEATRDRDGYAGLGVHAAARIGALGGGGEIVASYATIEGLEDVTVSERRSVPLRGIAERAEIVKIAGADPVRGLVVGRAQ